MAYQLDAYNQMENIHSTGGWTAVPFQWKYNTVKGIFPVQYFYRIRWASQCNGTIELSALFLDLYHSRNYTDFITFYNTEMAVQDMSFGDLSDLTRTLDPYTQMDKNTVAAANQLKQSEFVRFFNVAGKGKRVMFAGNSITLHGVKPDIGWFHEWGMAASAAENDYVHRLMSAICKIDPDAAFCVCHVAEWERQYQNGKKTYPLYDSACAFHADIIVMRFIENCPAEHFDKAVFKQELKDFLAYLNPTGKAKIILTTGFWHHPGDIGIVETATEMNLPLVRLGDLGERDEMKAIGLFEHSGVANHPGDLGMEKIADRIFGVLKEYL